MSPIFYNGRLVPKTVDMIDYRYYPKMYLTADMSADYLSGVQDAMHFILSTDPQAVPLSAANAYNRADELLEDKIDSMEAKI